MRSRRQNTAAALLEYDGSTARYKIRTHFCDLTKPESLTKVATQNCQVVYRPRYGFSPLPRVPRYFRPALPPWPLQHGVDIVAEKRDAGGGMFAKVRRVVYPGAGKLRAARTGVPSDDHAGWVIRAGHVRYLEWKGKNGDVKKRGGSCRAIRRLHRGEIVHGHAGGESGADQGAH
jgi:hypothetical protein